ncbi:MAG: histidine kinase [Bacteroidia bacterium]|nr:histidine kinase [Bacteroidia bacterium]
MNALCNVILRFRRAVLFLLLQTVLLPLHAQFEHYISLGNREGMPSNNIYQLLEGTDGFIWIGTNRGLVRYDGRTFRVFTTRDGLPTNDIWQMEITPDGKVWFISRSKRWGYIWKDRVYSFQAAEGTIPSSSFFFIDRDNLRFEGGKRQNTLLSGIFALRDNVWQFEDSLAYPESIRGVGLDMRGLILPGRKVMYTGTDPVYITDFENNRLFTLRNKGNGPMLTSFREVGLGRLWDGYLLMYMSRESATLFNLRDKSFVSRKLFDSSETQVFQGFAEYQRYGAHYFQGSKYNQFVIVDSNLNFIEKHNFPEIYPAAHILKDRGGNYWMAGPQGGLTVFPHYSLDVQRYFNGEKVTIVCQTGKELIVVAGGNTPYVRTNGDTLFKRIKHTIDFVISVNSYAPENLYYMGGRLGTLYGNDLHNLREVRYTYVNVKSGLRLPVHPNIKDMIRLPDGSYMALSGSRLHFFDRNLQTRYDIVYGPGRHYIYGARKLLYWNNTLYIGGDGMYRLHNDSVQVVPGLPESMQKGILYLLPFSKEYMLVGTDGSGVYLYDGAQRAIPVAGSEGFVINKIVLRNRAMWIATDNGVHRIEAGPDGHSSYLAESFYMEDGLLSNNVNSIDFTGDTLWAAHDQGLVALNLSRGKYRTSIRPFLDTRDIYRINDSTYALTYGDLENIELDFGVLALPVQKYMTYSFKLGENAGWFTSATTTLSLGKMNPGEQYIYFRAADQHGNSGQFRLLLQVRPLWYQTFWAKAGLVLLIILLATGVTLLLRLRAERRQKAALSLKGRMSELELQALRSQMNPHFVFNSLNAIQFFVIKNKVELSEAYLAKFSKLVRMFFEYSRYDSLLLEQEIDLLERYLEIEKLRFEDKLSYRVEVDERIDTEEMEIPSMILQPIVENAVNHGIFHKRGNGRVEVVFTYINDNSVHVQVKDDGVGIHAMREMYRNDTRNYRSRSSEVLKERLKILSENKLSKWQVKYSIRDLGEEDPGLTGTQVDIEFIYKAERDAR